MRIKIERLGGLAGRPARGEREDNELTALERAAIEALPRAPQVDPPTGGADRFHYVIEIETDSGSTILDVPEDRMPPILARMVKLVL